jgi:superfamily II DNA/RNA helicase
MPSFASLGVPPAVCAALAALGASAPFPIQAATLPDSMAGRDLLGRGKTGSGKTIAFAIPVVCRLAASTAVRRPNTPRALVLVPTRELANQVAATFAPLAQAMRLRVATVYGGVGFGNQIDSMRRGVDVVVACPGRLDDLVKQGHCRLDGIEITVLDEADHMSDMGFLPVVRRLLDKTPTSGQRLLFSATLDNDVKVVVDRYLTNPVTHAVDPVESPVSAMIHHLISVEQSAKLAVITRLAGGRGRALLFTRTKHGAKKLVKQLDQAGVRAVELHGNLSQSARERNLAEFSTGDVKVLVATDIAARGIHVDEIELVVHVDPPAEHKAFLHRSGRTARAGSDGVVITVMTPDQGRDVRAMTRAAGIRPIVTDRVDAAHPLLTELVGPVRPQSARHTRPAVTVAPTAAPGQRTGPTRVTMDGRPATAPARHHRRRRQNSARPARG